MIRTIVFYLYALLCLSHLFAQQEIIPLSSSMYTHIDDEYIRRGLAPPFSSRPWTMDEAIYYYEHIGLAPHSDLVTGHLYSNKGFAFNISPTISLEGYLKTNQDGKETYERPWLYGYNDRLPIIDLKIGADLGRNMYMGSNIPIMQEYAAVNHKDNISNVFLNLDYMEVNFPLSAYASLGGLHWSVFIGRDKLSMGPGYSGKLIVSDNPHWLDQLRFSTWWENFRYTATIIYNQPYLEESEREIVTNKIGEQFTDNRYLIFHRFDMRFFKIWNIGVTEGLSWGGRTLDLRFLNPVIVLHNFYEWDYASSLFSIDTQLLPLPGLQIYGQFMFNAIQSEYEKHRYNANSIPSASGWMAGLSYQVPIETTLKFGIEFVHTDPWLYIREHPLISYYWRRRAISNIGGDYLLISLPLGYSWGPDTNLFMVWSEVDWNILSNLSLNMNFSFSFVQDGQQTITSSFDTGPEAIALKTPSGIAEIYSMFHIEPVLFLTLNSHHQFSLRLNSDIFWIKNAGHQKDKTAFDAQFALSLSWIIQP